MTKEHLSFAEDFELGDAVATELTQQQGETPVETLKRLALIERVARSVGDTAAQAA